MSRVKKSRKTRRRNTKSNRQVSRGETNTGTILSQIPASVENVPEFLMQAKNAFKAGNTEQTRELLCDENVRQVENMPQSPSKILAIYMLASQLMKIKEYDKAEKWYKKVLEYGQFSFAYNNLGYICQEKAELIQAVEYGRKALELEPNDPKLLCTFGVELLAIGKVDEAFGMLKKAAVLDPDNLQIATWLLKGMHYKTDVTPQMLFEEHRNWAKRYAPITMAKVDHDNLPDPDRKIRIGYISPNFHKHSVTHFFEPILDAHDHNAFEIYAYSNSDTIDQFTERMIPKFDTFRDVHGIGNTKTAEIIEQDKIDILVDLAGHTKNNCLLTMARKPAPIQVTYLGYPDTTGLEQIDYRITDDLADPPQLHKFYSEKQICLPNGFLCYRPPDFAVPLAPSPHIKNGYITFGSFNINSKISSLLIALWAQILKANENSRFLLKFRGAGNPCVQDYYRAEFARFGIPPENIEMYGRISPTEHMALYGKMDIALDTYPYHGTTTTCEALWMGVPVISLVGGHHSCRVSLSLLKRLEMDFFIATTPDEYVSKATALAAKPEALAKIRDTMRYRMAASDLCNNALCTKNLETAYKEMWHKWCKSRIINAC